MKLPVLVLSFFFLANMAFGQANERRMKRDEIEAQKVSFITSQLELSPEEAKAFWPLYNSYRNELQELRKKERAQSAYGATSADDLTDKELDNLMKKNFAIERQIIDLDERYYEKFKSVLPVSKVVAFYAAERDFKRELLKALKENRGQAKGNMGKN